MRTATMTHSYHYQPQPYQANSHPENDFKCKGADC